MIEDSARLSRAPLLEAERVRLRCILASDFDAVHRLGCEPIVYQGISGQPPTPEQSWEKLLKTAGGWELMGYGSWIVEDKASKIFLGIAGLMNAQRELEPPQAIAPESGWSLMPHAHGKGLAFEAMQLALGWFDAAFPNHASHAMINLDNTASMKLAERLGYQEGSVAKYKGHQVKIWRRNNPLAQVD